MKFACVTKDEAEAYCDELTKLGFGHRTKRLDSGYVVTGYRRCSRCRAKATVRMTEGGDEYRCERCAS